MAVRSDVFDCEVVEVGSGPGSLTRSLLTAGVRHVHAVEIDKRFMPSLDMLKEASDGHLSVHNYDILKMDIPSVIKDPITAPWESEDLPNVRLVGNLPFNVSIPLILQWLEAISKQKGPWKFGRVPMALVFQREVSQDMVATPGNKDRSRVSIMTQNYCTVKKSMLLRSSVFTPEPKVDAWMMHFVPRSKPLVDASFGVLEQVVKGLYSFKGKHIRNSAGQLFPDDKALGQELLVKAEVPPYLRPYQLSFEDLNRITNSFLELCAKHELSTYPLRVRKPSPVVDEAEEKLHITDM